MPSVTQTAIANVKRLMEDPQGLTVSIAALRSSYEQADAAIDERQIGLIHAPAELHERTGKPVYPVFHIYVERIRNRMTEKFRRFSGSAEVVVEVRLSQDRLEGLTERLQLYACAVGDVIERRRGCVAEGIYLPGTYEVVFEAVKRGGLNFIQSARVKCDLEMSRG